MMGIVVMTMPATAGKHQKCYAFLSVWGET
jgi:hypothetical protein